jgi:hypothetical protein
VGGLSLPPQASLAPHAAWSAPYRSESFAEDLPLSAPPAPVAPKSRWQATLLLALPLTLALIGSLLPIVHGQV